MGGGRGRRAGTYFFFVAFVVIFVDLLATLEDLVDFFEDFLTLECWPAIKERPGLGGAAKALTVREQITTEIRAVRRVRFLMRPSIAK